MCFNKFTEFKMSAFEIIDNLDNLDYKFDKEKYIGYEYDDYDIINNKYSEIEDQIFKSLSLPNI